MEIFRCDAMTNLDDDDEKKRKAATLVAILSQKFFALYYTQKVAMELVRPDIKLTGKYAFISYPILTLN